MAEEKVEVREANWRTLLPWTELFRGFQVALDLNKLLLAAAGILVLASGWWLLSVIFTAGYDKTPPGWPTKYRELYAENAWARFKQDRESWNIMHEAADLGGAQRFEVADLAESEAEYKLVQDNITANADALTAIDKLVRGGELSETQGRRYKRYLGREKPAGTLATWPWYEDRGPNPFLLVTGQAGIPWETGRFWEWFTREQVPVMIEPVIKLMRPIVYFFSPRAEGFWPRLYFACVMLVTLAVWALFGGAITRIAAVQVARGEKIGLTEAVRFTLRRLVSYVTAPLFPLGFVLVLVIFMILFGFLHMIPVVGDIFVSGLFWWVMIFFGLAIAVALVGLVGWPLMAATISTEGTDSWEAVSRAYSYVYQRPWHFLWNSLVAVTYAGVVFFFAGFMTSFGVYLAKWGVAQTPGVQAVDRDPSFLFVYAPRSFGWRALLLEGAKVEGVNLVQDGRVAQAPFDRYLSTLKLWNKVGAWLVAVWLGVVFLLFLGLGYSLFWSEVTIIYLLLRKEVEAAEMDEVHLEEEDIETPFGAGGYTTPPAPAPAQRATGTPLAMVEPPRPAPPPAAPPPAAVPAAPAVAIEPPSAPPPGPEVNPPT
jgi:hypothetical protein